MDRILNAVILFCVLSEHAGAQSPDIRDAFSALALGDFRAAEQKLRAEIAANPDNAQALSLLGAALDNLKRMPEADEFHHRAVAKAPRSTEVLNNYAAHLWITGNEPEARKVYLRVVAIEPAHYNANLQLARLALKEHSGQEALRCLDRLSASQSQNPQVLLARLQALYLVKDGQRADALVSRLQELARTDLNLSLAAGTILAGARQYEKAENFFEIALKSDPANFNVLYDLGVMATQAGHLQRAQEVFDTALRQQPQNVNVLYAMARVDEALHHAEEAIRLLAQAAKLDPARADVQKLLALTTAQVGALDDAASAWDRYLKLEPNDDDARRERAYLDANMGQLEQGIAGLERFVARHPDDVMGHYELGQAERSVDMAKALAQFDKALALDPNYVPARTARGGLYYQQGKPEAALKDLEIAAGLRQDDAGNLDRLGQTYQALDRTDDAVRVLRRAAELAPDDSKILLHFARALADAGSIEESRTVMERFRQLGPEKRTAVRAGFVEYLSQTPEQRHADYRSRVEKEVRNHPDDAAVQVGYLKLVLEEGNAGANETATVVHRIAALKPGAAVLADAGRALLWARHYGLARELLNQAAAAGRSPDIQLDLALATFRGGDIAKGLELLDRLPAPARNSDYHLTRAEVLDASGRAQEALAALEQAMQSAGQRADLYQRGAAFLVRKDNLPEAERLLDGAARKLPGNRDILLMTAIARELAGHAESAGRSLAEIRTRWPEWFPVWLADGIVLHSHGHFDEACKSLETALALGARGPEVYFYLADCALRSGDYSLAAERCREAIRLRPDFAQAHMSLAKAYNALGRQREAQAEQELTKTLPASNDTPSYLKEFIVGQASRPAQ